MQTTTHYSLTKAEGADTVNLLTQCYPNFDTIDYAMFENKQSSVGVATEVTTGTVHAITRGNTDSNIFRFTATSSWTAGDTMTLDGVGVSVHLPDGTTPQTGAYIIGAEVFGFINGSLVTLLLSSKISTYVETFNGRSNAVTPQASDYDASMVDYDNSGSGLLSTDSQGAIDECASRTQKVDVSNYFNINSNNTASFSAFRFGDLVAVNFSTNVLAGGVDRTIADFASGAPIIPTDAQTFVIYNGSLTVPAFVKITSAGIKLQHNDTTSRSFSYVTVFYYI